MRYLVIEVEKPSPEASNYTELLAQRVAQGHFEVVAVCSSEEEANEKLAPLLIKNAKQQSGLHYEILSDTTDPQALAEEIRYTFHPESRHIKQFFTEARRRLVSVRAIEAEAGVPRNTLLNLLTIDRPIPLAHLASLTQVLVLIGYQPPAN